VDEVSASAEETDTQVKANAAAAGQASQLVTGAAAVAEEGREKIGQMVTAMEGIRASSQDIGKIIKVIDEIAFQTNLLALNAAVEAARAGQHGRGFAVVAQEVRNLAGRSAKAARETSELIESAGARVQAGVKIADETSRAFTTIAGDIEKVRSFMREISVASDEQARGVAQINTAMSEAAKTALATSQQADEVAASAAEILTATDRMRGALSRFQLRPADYSRGNGLPDLSNLSPEMLAQVQAMLAAQSARSTPASTLHPLRNADRDERGFSGF
jgi:methyl-accepting chemotaxis protein